MKQENRKQSQPPQRAVKSAKGRRKKFVAIAIFPDEAEARMSASRLVGEKIPARVDDHISAWSGPASARLLVPPDSVVAAVQILKTTPAATRLTVDAEGKPLKS